MERTVTINQALKNRALIHWLLALAFFLGGGVGGGGLGYSPVLPTLSSLAKSLILFEYCEAILFVNSQTGR